jgi:septum formation protein
VRDLILASSSRYRATLLERLALPFRSCSPDIDERPLPGETPQALVTRLAAGKAAAGAALAAPGTSALVIGSDQVAVSDDAMLGKPGTAARAREQLATLSGRRVTFLTGLCLLDTASGDMQQQVAITEVAFRTLDPAEIADYVAREQPLDCAGAFKSEALGIALLDAIRSDDPTALIGLPLIALCRMLRQAGVAVLGAQHADA